MSTLEEIEEAIGRLPRKEVLELRDWIQERIDREWDRQFAEDVESGRLKEAAAAAIAEYRAGKAKDFPGDEE